MVFKLRRTRLNAYIKDSIFRPFSSEAHNNLDKNIEMSLKEAKFNLGEIK